MADGVTQDIKERLDIAEVIGSYIQLKRAGANWRANCPFHNEKTPSFNVNPARQIWHCFGCNEGGDVFTFVQKYEHVEFPEALQLLAARAGVTLPEYSGKDKKAEEQKETLYRINNFAARFYHQVLTSPAGQSALAYLTGRGLTLETIQTWQIGYAPEDPQILQKALTAKGVRVDDMLLAGVLGRSTRGTYDRFRGRITFPILDTRGQVIGFSARILVDNDRAAKYINSPESPIYRKSNALFGIYHAKAEISQSSEVVVVEGQMDCIKVWQAGFTNTIATSGTALTEEHIRLLKRFAKLFYFAFDADKAGQTALYRASQLALSVGSAVKVVRISGAKDPDELISKDTVLWKQAIATAPWVVEYFISQADAQYTARSLEQRQYLSKMVLPLVGLLSDALEREYYIQKLDAEFGVGGESIRTVLASQKPVGQNQTAPQKQPLDIPLSSEPVPALEKTILGALYIPEFRLLFVQEGVLEDFSHEDARLVAACILHGEPLPPALQTLAGEAQFMVESQSQTDGTQGTPYSELKKLFYMFRLSSLKAVLEHITYQLRQAERNNAASSIAELKERFAHVSTTRLELERKIQSL